MDDTISRAAAVKTVKKHYRGIDNDLLEVIAYEIEALPSAQPEIMRCKDCRYNNDCEIQYNAQSGDEFFCGCAERKDNG